MRISKVIACVVILTAVLAVQAAMAQSAKLEGVWKIVEITAPGPKPTVITNVQPSIGIITKKYCSIISLTAVQPKLPDKATDAQKVATWTPVNAGAGTYEIKGSTLTVHLVVAKEPVEPGEFVAYDFKLEGDTLVLTPKATSHDGPIKNPITLRCKRLE